MGDRQLVIGSAVLRAAANPEIPLVVLPADLLVVAGAAVVAVLALVLMVRFG